MSFARTRTPHVYIIYDSRRHFSILLLFADNYLFHLSVERILKKKKKRNERKRKIYLHPIFVLLFFFISLHGHTHIHTNTHILYIYIIFSLVAFDVSIVRKVVVIIVGGIEVLVVWLIVASGEGGRHLLSG